MACGEITLRSCPGLRLPEIDVDHFYVPTTEILLFPHFLVYCIIIKNDKNIISNILWLEE